MKNNNIVLFDMDGTLTEVRKEITKEMIYILQKLSRIAKIGIVTGSDYDYLIDQCEDMWTCDNSVSPDNVLLMPCNGTKLYRWNPKHEKHTIEHDKDMRKEIGRSAYNDLLCSLTSHQIIIMAQNDISYSGTFFQYRGSMLNWCPTGRSASIKEREEWISLDQKKGLREFWLNHLENRFKKEEINLSAALGGSTSVDIYPTGWDKTYSLNHVKDYTPWFVGDKCFKGGNDLTLYEALRKSGRGYSTSGPEETIGIIHNIMSKIKNNKVHCDEKG